ncbi:ogr/Delta-like zinc finger family protein [Morganella psychrotolerans]
MDRQVFKRLYSGRHLLKGSQEMRTLKLYCPQCSSASTIRKIETEGLIIPELYCSCNDPECGYTYVVTITYSHTIRQSKLDVPLPHRGLCIKVLNRQNAR